MARAIDGIVGTVQERTAVIVEREGAVVRLTLDRPEQHNPLTARCIREVLDGVSDAGADPTIRVIIIRGAGRSFCSGYGVLPDDLGPGEADRPPTIEADVQAMLALSTGWGRL